MPFADTDNTPYRLASALPVDPPSGKCLPMPECESQRMLIRSLATTAEVRPTKASERLWFDNADYHTSCYQLRVT